MRMKKLITIIMAAGLLSTSGFALSTTSTSEYRNIDGDKITESISDECESALRGYIKYKDKVKMYLAADDDKMIISTAKITLRWAIEAKSECQGSIPGDWEKELNTNIPKLTEILKDN